MQYAAGRPGEWWWKPPSVEAYQTIQSPYNTYLWPGLPPTAIASPGLSAIQAAAAPADTQYCFFVAAGDGAHVYATTLAEHQANIARYQTVMHMANSRWQMANGTQQMAVYSLLFAVCCLLSACAMPGDAAPVVKIGVIAPFEGAGRPLGYAVLPAIKAAAAEANASGELGRYQVVVVAFNDDLHGPTAAAQAQALALDLRWWRSWGRGRRRP